MGSQRESFEIYEMGASIAIFMSGRYGCRKDFF